MTLSEFRRQLYIAKSRNMKPKEWFVSQDEFDDLLEELREFCMTQTYIEDKSVGKEMKILGVEIKVKEN